jgi:hypothetical protein
LNGEFKLFGEFRGSLVAGASAQRDINSRSFGRSGGFNSSNGFGSNGFGSSGGFNGSKGLSSNDKYSLLANFGRSI